MALRYVYGSAFATKRKATLPSPSTSSTGSNRPRCSAMSLPSVARKAASPGRPSRERCASIRLTSSASKKSPALKRNLRPLTRPTEIVRVRPCSNAAPSCSAARSGSRGIPSARGNTLVPPPGMHATGGASSSSPLTTSLNPPSPERTKIASAPADSRASSVPCPRRSVNRVSTSPCRPSARSTAATRCSSTAVASGLTISAMWDIPPKDATHRPRRSRDARSRAHGGLLRARVRRAHRQGRGPSGDGVSRRDRLCVSRARRSGRSHGRARLRGRARRDQAPSRRRGNRLRGTRSRYRHRTVLPRSRRPATRSDHLSQRRRPTPYLRRGVAAHAVEQELVEAIRESVGVRIAPQPRVRPVRSREREQGRGRVVEIGSQSAELASLAEERAKTFLVAAALGEELVASLALEISPLADEHGGDVELPGDDVKVRAQREPDLVRGRQVVGDFVERLVEGGRTLACDLPEEIGLRRDVRVERALLHPHRLGKIARGRSVVPLLREQARRLAQQLVAPGRRHRASSWIGWLLR